MSNQSWPNESYYGRWMMIKRISQKQVELLHRLENIAFEKEETWWSKGKIPPPDCASWQAIGISCFMDFNAGLGLFWPQFATREWKEAEIAKYKKAIYPLWRPIWDKYEASMIKTPKDKGYVNEIETVHRCDLAIYDGAPPFPPEHIKSTKTKTDDLETNEESQWVASHGLGQKDKMAGDAYQP